MSISDLRRPDAKPVTDHNPAADGIPLRIAGGDFWVYNPLMGDFIVMDLEWNQGSPKKTIPEMPFEIIEIGSVRLDPDLIETGRFHRLIRPTAYPSMHYINAKIVHLKNSDLKPEKGFKTVAEEFLDWCGNLDEVTFCTWGDMDLTELQRNLRYHGMPPLCDGPMKYLDIQKLFSLSEENGKIRRSLEYAVRSLQIRETTGFHRALADASYTGMIFREIAKPELLERVSFDVYQPPVTREKEIHIRFDTYSKDIYRLFPDKQSLLEDPEVCTVRCCFCGRRAKQKIRWFPASNKHLLSLCSCRMHGLLRSKLRIRKADNGMVYGIKTTRSISEADSAALYQKSRKSSKMRPKH